MEEDGTAWYADGAPGTQSVLQEGPSDMHLKDETPLEGPLDTHTPMDAADSNALTAINVEAHVTSGHQVEGQQGALLPLEEVDGFFTSLDSSGTRTQTPLLQPRPQPQPQPRLAAVPAQRPRFEIGKKNYITLYLRGLAKPTTTTKEAAAHTHGDAAP
ncbi:hypothetical protein O3P69_000587 [Scylla paramamosain]|uniref:Uncharacterized protein n=1 Tax=Scylla paramamosain TaxID=85552 RepID=A0AAW0UTE7_SCYPA